MEPSRHSLLPLGGARALALIVLGAHLSAWMQVVSAQCAKTATPYPISGSDFAADYNVTASNATRACFQIGNGRACDVDAGLCCLGKTSRRLAKYTSVTFSLSNGTGCLPIPAVMKKTTKWSVNGKPKRGKNVGGNVTVTVGLLAATPVTLCVDFLAGFNQSCSAMEKLCGGTSCKVSLQLSKVTKKPDPLNQTTWTTGVSCCLSGQADLRTCDVGSQQGCASNALCKASVIEGAARGVCTCPTGYGGDPYTQCTDVDECAANNGGCHPVATCTNTIGGRVCECAAGYAGDGVTCTDSNKCATNNGGCHADAVCTHTIAGGDGGYGGYGGQGDHGGYGGYGGFTCTCKPGYSGDGLTNCTDINECATANGGCHTDAVCNNTKGGRTCACKQGYSGDGVTNCTDIDECATGNGDCHTDAVCTNTNGGHTCKCKPGYSGDGVANCTDVDECTNNNGGCHTDAVCNNTEGGRSCTCNQGYSGDGVTNCTDIDECATNNGGCGDKSAGACNNTAGGYVCVCNPGFEPVGRTCLDVNECATGNSGCHTDAVCNNTVGGRTCTCKQGYSGDGVTNCTVINDCATGNGGCHTDAVCNITAGGVTCTCMQGYSGDGVTNCTDVDECASSNGGCDANAACNNTIGGRTCTCNEGYYGSGTKCTDINECTTNNGGCHYNAICTNTNGSYTCACRSGYSGDGITSCAGSNAFCWGRKESASGAELLVPGGYGVVKGIHLGPRHTCAVLPTGEVRCFGDDDYNQTNVPSGLPAAKSMALGRASSCVLTAARAVACFGDPNSVYNVSAVPSALQAAGSTLALSAGDFFACAVAAGGRVACWGSAPSIPVDLAANGAAAAAIASGRTSTCVVTTNKMVECFGSKTVGQLDAPANVSGVVQVCTSDAHACAAKEDGRVVCWGDNSNLQAQPPAGLVGVKMVACGDKFSVAVTTQGALRIWGTKPPNTPSNLGAATSVSARGQRACVLLGTGVNECLLGSDNCHPNATCQDTIDGFNCTCNTGFSGDGVTCTPDVDPCQSKATNNCTGNATCTAVAGGYTCACNTGYDGDGVTSCVKISVICWDYYNDAVVDTVPSSLGRAKAVAASTDESYFTCAIRESDSRVLCWGKNVTQLDVPSDMGPVAEVAVGSFTPCALTAGGAVRCWGADDGSGLLTQVPSQLKLNGSTKNISLGADHGCAITAAGALVTWGTLNTSVVPSDLQQAGAVASVSCGYKNGCVVTPAGLLRCFGDNYYNQTMVPAYFQSEVVKAVSVGTTHTCAVLVNGTASCFGSMYYVDGATFNYVPISLTPDFVPSDLGPVKMISSGFSASGAVTASGELRMLPNVDATYGDIVADEYGPTPDGLGPVVAVSLGYAHACAILDG